MDEVVLEVSFSLDYLRVAAEVRASVIRRLGTSWSSSSGDVSPLCGGVSGRSSA